MGRAVRRSPPPRMTLDEFLEWPGEGRQELVDGVLRAMSPASAAHGTIQANLAYFLKRRLDERGSSCRATTEAAIIPRLGSDRNLRVADLAVTCTPPERGEMAVPDPVLLIEILSPTNAAETREKIFVYASIPSVREILLVQSTRVEAELLRRRASGDWPEGPEILKRTDILRLDSVDFEAPIAALYTGTHLAPAGGSA